MTLIRQITKQVYSLAVFILVSSMLCTILEVKGDVSYIVLILKTDASPDFRIDHVAKPKDVCDFMSQKSKHEGIGEDKK